MKLLIVIPAFNEEKMISKVIRNIPKKIHPFTVRRVLVINDGSLDNTVAVVKKYKVSIISHMLNRGLGAVLATGFKYAQLGSFDALVTIDADGQHKGKDIQRILRPIILKKSDVVIGSRLLTRQGMPFTRRIVNYVSNIITWLLFSVWTTDSQSGLRAFNKQAIQKIKIRSQRMEVSSEIFKEISRLRLRLAEVPISSIYTTYSLAKGQSLSNAPNVFWKLLLHKFS